MHIRKIYLQICAKGAHLDQYWLVCLRVLPQKRPTHWAFFHLQTPVLTAIVSTTCMYVCMYACMYACMYGWMYAC